MISVSETPPLSRSYCVALQTYQPSACSALISHWWSFIWLVGFVLRNYRACDSYRYVCPASSSVIVKEIWWWHQPYVSEGECGRAIATPLFTLCVSRADVTLEERRAEDTSPLWMLPVYMSVCLCGHVEQSEGNRVVQVGGRVEGGLGRGGSADAPRCKSPRPSCTTHAVQTGSTLACVLSRQVADILI